MYKNVLLRLLTLNKLCRIWKDVFAFPLLDATLNILQLFDFLCVSYLAVTENLKQRLQELKVQRQFWYFLAKHYHCSVKTEVNSFKPDV